MTLKIVFDHTIKDKHIINPYSTESWLFTLKIGKKNLVGSDGQNNTLFNTLYMVQQLFRQPSPSPSPSPSSSQQLRSCK